VENVNLKDLMGDVPYHTVSRFEREVEVYKQNQYPKSEVILHNEHVLIERIDMGPSHVWSVMNMKGLDKLRLGN